MKPRSGVVLLLALLCVVALELTAVGLHFAALQEVQAARAGARTLQLRLSAQTAAAAAVATWPVMPALATPVGDFLPLPAAAGTDDRHHVQFSASAERLGAELFLVRGEGTSPLGETARVGYLVIAPDPARHVPTAAIRTGAGVTLAAAATVVAGAQECGLEQAPPALQLPDTDLLTVAPDTRVTGSVDVRPEQLGAALESLVPLPFDELLAAAVAIPGNTVSPAPVLEDGHCLTGSASNWGEPDPAASGAPCAHWFPVLHRSGNLAIHGGRGQGTLVVTGDLILSGAATFSGLVLVAGSVTITDGAAINGAVISAGTLTAAAAAITGDRCLVSAALAAVPALAGPFSPPGRRWIPLF
jgi:hypothetical protein